MIFFIFLLGFIILGIIVIINLKFEIEVNNLEISTVKKREDNGKYSNYINIIIFNKIKLARIDINKIKKPRAKEVAKNIIKRIENEKEIFKDKKIYKAIIGEFLANLKHLKFEIKKLDLELELGLTDAAQTAILVAAISSIVGILLKSQISPNNNNNFQVLPLYINKNIFNLKLNCIIRINLIHYIYKNKFKNNKEKGGNVSHILLT